MLRLARDFAFKFADWLILFVPARGPRRGIAVIMPHGLGDLLLVTPAFQHIRAHFQGEPILLVCSASAQAYAVTYLQPDQILLLDRVSMRWNLRHRIRVLVAMARAGARVALQPNYHREHLIEDAVMRAARADVSIGSWGSPILITSRERACSDPWYSTLIHEPSELPHEADFYATFCEAVTGSRPPRILPKLFRPGLHPDVPKSDYVVVACEASSVVKAWPAERFLETARAISAQTGFAIVLVGEFASQSSGEQGMIDLRGATDLTALISVLAHAKLVLCNDSAPVHLAAALGVQVVAVGGGGIPDRYLPYPTTEPHPAPPVLVTVDPAWACFGCGWRCQYAVPAGQPLPCVTDVSLDQVLNACLAALHQPSRMRALPA